MRVSVFVLFLLLCCGLLLEMPALLPVRIATATATATAVAIAIGNTVVTMSDNRDHSCHTVSMYSAIAFVHSVLLARNKTASVVCR